MRDALTYIADIEQRDVLLACFGPEGVYEHGSAGYRGGRVSTWLGVDHVIHGSENQTSVEYFATVIAK
ncbi:Uncharacterised protein [Mycobacteroides abscessus subsp. abscessus]|nr:Uncharacterised protein [Mycobacteroides abscessus]SHX14826.1 Uncharacterised protein [Mycobacteroides abscessus subsp. abscessus]SIL98879.1 Uncharacterised protein [Mycobacteroides abscessus subsp. abscessus]